MTALTVSLKPTIDLTDDQFYELCRNNPDLQFEQTALQFEQTAKGELIIMPPTGGETGNRNFSLLGQLWLWVEEDGTGLGFDSSTAFKLPNGATRAPDAAWIRRDRWETLTAREKERFPPIAPDFVVELCSRTDDLEEAQQKMQEYIANGVRLGWILNPQDQQVEIYRLGKPVEVLTAPYDAFWGRGIA
jgi:Uma2 family endonuclease